LVKAVFGWPAIHTRLSTPDKEPAPKVENLWLPSGVYTLEAALAGEPRIGATTLFEVVAPEGPNIHPEPPQHGGLKGQVFAPTAANELIAAPGARIVVEELLAANTGNLNRRTRFRWTGLTNEEGRFELRLPAGRFRVVAQWSETEQELMTDLGEPASITLPLRASKEVVITSGENSEVRLDLKAGLVEIGTQLVYSVSSVGVRFIPTFAPPSMLEVSAQGMVNTGGWSQAKLRQRGVTPEGIIEFDFVAKPPEGMATQAFAPISATAYVPQPSNFRGVRVYAHTNNMGSSKAVLVE
ncbi:MAG: carboxypeptidase regulatory-like domain-containing protein, partial [Verrucomicrobiaceae bacterium]